MQEEKKRSGVRYANKKLKIIGKMNKNTVQKKHLCYYEINMFTNYVNQKKNAEP